MKKIRTPRSPKAHIPDPAKKREFKEKTTPALKLKKHKLTRGTFRGKRWFPY